MQWRLAIHGGAGSMRPGRLDPEAEHKSRAGLAAALEAGAQRLASGGSAVDAVEAAARALEEDLCFNAGRGSVLAADGHIELDAAIMDGRTRRAGAVAGLRTTRAPISLARQLMERGPHVFLAGTSADEGSSAVCGIGPVPSRNRHTDLASNHGSDGPGGDTGFRTGAAPI